MKIFEITSFSENKLEKNHYCYTTKGKYVVMSEEHFIFLNNLLGKKFDEQIYRCGMCHKVSKIDWEYCPYCGGKPQKAGD